MIALRSVRRLRLALALLALLAACNDADGATTPAAQPSTSVSAPALLVPAAAGAPQVVTPTAVPTPRPLTLTLPVDPVPQGGSFAVIVEGGDIAGVQVSFAGRTYPAVVDGGGWLTIVGAGQRIGGTEQHPPGVYPVEAVVTLAGGETHSLAGAVTVTATRFPVEEIDFDPQTSALLDPALTQRELAILIPLLTHVSPQRLWDGYFLRPTSGPITDVFGSRRSYNGGPATGSHSGVDFGADAGTPVRAAATGRVVYAGPLPVRGNAIYIDHGAGVFTGYNHLSRITVEIGQEVHAGGQIGNVGATGLVTGPHLHWEVSVGGYYVNGLFWLQEEQ